MRAFGVLSSGSPSSLIVGGPSSRLQLVMKLSRSTGDPMARRELRALIGADEIALPSGIAGDVPPPPRAPVQRCAEVRAVRLIVARQRREQGFAEPDERTTLIVLGLGVNRRRNIAENGP